MLVLDLTIVAVALADIQRGLSASLDELQWVVDAYAVALAALLLTVATLGDRIGHRGLFVAGTAVFTIGSLGCALATTGWQLDVLRAVQGLGGSALWGVGLPMIANAYPEARGRAKAIGIFGAVSGGALALGPLVGGALTGAFGWRSIFLVNVPVGLIAIVVAWLRLSPSIRRAGSRVDWAGALTSTAALTLIVLACVRGNEDGWSSPTILTLLGTAAALLVAFVVIELRRRDPMLDLRLFARPLYTANAVTAFVAQGAIAAYATYSAIYLQNVLGYTPFQTGLAVLPLTIMAFVAAVPASRLGGRVPARVLVAVTAGATCAGMALFTLVSPESTWLGLVPGFVVAGIGLAGNSTVINTIALGSAPPERAGMASGGVMTLKQVGTAVCVAVFGAVFQSTAGARALQELPGNQAAADGIADGLGLQVVQHVPEQVRAAVAETARTATVAGLDAAAWVGAGLALFALVVALVAARPAPVGGGARDHERAEQH